MNQRMECGRRMPSAFGHNYLRRALNVIIILLSHLHVNRSNLDNMVHYKLVYFDTRGRAEPVRLIFAQAGVEYEDRRVTTAEWMEMKPDTPFGTLPILEVDGQHVVSGSGPIARFVAEKLGLAGSSDLENAILAGIADAMNDVLLKISACYFEKDEKRKKDIMEDVMQVHLPKLLGNLCKMASGNNCVRGWIRGPRVTYIDIGIYFMVDLLQELFGREAERLWASGKYNSILKIKKSVESLPNVARWLADPRRPKSDFHK